MSKETLRPYDRLFIQHGAPIKHYVKMIKLWIKELEELSGEFSFSEKDQEKRRERYLVCVKKVAELGNVIEQESERYLELWKKRDEEYLAYYRANYGEPPN